MKAGMAANTLILLCASVAGTCVSAEAFQGDVTAVGDGIQGSQSSLEGKPAPALETSTWLGPKPQSIASLRGKAVLLFFWAHWCPNCKAEVFVISDLMKKYGPKGLALIGPTRYYGYAVRGDAASPDVEKPYIDVVRREYYTLLASMPVPLSNANFANYNADSSTPTIVLVDRKGIVRWYHPGAATERELATHIEAVLK